MSATAQTYLPTAEALKTPFPADVDAEKVARKWLDSFSNALSSNNVDAILSHIHPDGWCRDILLTNPIKSSLIVIHAVLPSSFTSKVSTSLIEILID